ncbi:hypothetical protein F5879DRAFT_927221 [Lentinula edodes]|nr:hypothetical protein F5879DRAFT_927221 [Lentinula edodes]
MPDPRAYSQPTSRTGFSSREAYAQPTPHMDFPSPGIEFSSGYSASVWDNNHQTRPDIVQTFQSVNGRHYTSGSFSLGYNLPPHSDLSAVTNQKGHSGSSQRGALQWKETSSRNPFPSCEPSPTLAPSAGPCFGGRPLSHEPLSTPPFSLSPQLSSHSSTLNSLSSLAHLANPRLSGRSVSGSPLPLGEESLSSVRGSSGEADSLLVHSGTNGVQSTPVSLVHSALDGIKFSPVSTGQTEQLQVEQEKKVVDLADTHGVAVSRLKKLAGTSKHHRKRRVNSIQDAILHAKSKELVQGRRYKAKINEIQQAAELDHDLQNAKTDPDKLKVLMDELEEHQQAKKDVARASNKAGAMKATKLLQGFNSDFHELRRTTDIAGFGFFVRESFESSIKPTIVGGGPVLEFFQKYFNKDPWEMACLFEVFVTTYNKVGSRKLLHSEKAKVTSKTISESLAHITGIDKIRMNYPNFRTKISAKYKVKIIGWLIDVPLVSPRDITNPSKLNTLYNAWRSGSAYWSTMDKREYKKFMQQLDNDKAAGLQIEISRTGQKNDTEEPPAKRKRTSLSTNKTAIIVQDQDANDDEENMEEDQDANNDKENVEEGSEDELDE